MNVKEHDNPAEVFELMVEATENLAERLDAELKIGDADPWEEDKLAELHAQLSE
jgi:hypothetical protein